MDVLNFFNEPTKLHVKIYNTTVKTYFDGSKKIKYHTYNTVKGLQSKKRKSSGGDKENKDYCKYKNLYKSKQKLIDLVYHNSLISSWEYFVTLTFDPEKVNSLDYNIVSESLQKWINNMKHQNPGMSYVIVPEFHKSGRVHWHGVFKEVPNWSLSPARSEKTGKLIYKNGTQIFNLDNYKYGYTTVSKIKNQEAVSVYCSKYMTKELIDLNYKKRYWSSRNLSLPDIEYAYFNEDTLQYWVDKVTEGDIYKSNTTISFQIKKLT